MSASNDAPDEMTSDPLIDDAYVERLLRRRGLGADGDRDPAGSFVAAIADLGRSTPAPTGALAVLLAEGFDPALEPSAAASLEEPSRSALRARPRRRAGFRLGVRILAGTGIAVVGLATAASAGVLPAPVQERVSGVLEATTPFTFPSVRTSAPNAPAVTPPGSSPGRTAPEDGRRAPDPATDVPRTTRPTTPTVELPAVVPAPDEVPGPPAAPGRSELRPGQRGGPSEQPPGPSERAPGRDRSPGARGGSQLVPPGLVAKR